MPNPFRVKGMVANRGALFSMSASTALRTGAELHDGKQDSESDFSSRIFYLTTVKSRVRIPGLYRGHVEALRGFLRTGS